ncbi:hypothetical protein QLX08_011276 [Tetragonisca angustula]|uniref:Odorant receptor n=1 Tax=Tetragonisca angustula TaxID=166442 RepID=A0AAW0Z8L5_9HYME
MDSAQYGYLRLNKYLLFIMGIWPYQTVQHRSLASLIFIPVIVAQLILQAGGFVTAIIADDLEASLESFAPLMISFMCISKYINFFYNFEQMRRLLDIMQDDWRIYKKRRNEYDLLSEQYAIGKRFVTGFVVSLLGFVTPFATVPLVLNAADALGLCNISDDRPLAFRIEHFVNVDKYYNVLLIHSFFGTLGYTLIALAVNCMMVTYVIHESGLCEILRVRLENFVEIDTADVDLHPSKRDDKWYENAKGCVLLHKHIIEFANILEDANTTCYFIIIGFDMICISFTQFQTVINLENDPPLALRYVSLSVCLLCDLLFISWPGQRLTNSSERIFEFATNGKWYQSSISCRKLLTMMLARSLRPLKLTACKFYTLNLQSFSAVARTSFSYCMVLCSIQ